MGLAMNQQRKRWVRLIALGVVVLLLLGVGVAAGPDVMDWLKKPAAEKEAAGPEAPSAQFFSDANHRPGLRLSSEVIKSLMVTTARVEPVKKKRPLPPQLGQLAYDIDRLYPVRSIANGRVIKIEEVFDPTLRGKSAYRPLGFSDRVKEGELLAVVRSPDLADKKGAYADALLDLAVDRERLENLEPLFRRGSIPPATYRDAKAKVQKDVLAVARARRVLELVPLEREDIKNLEAEAREIQKHFKEMAKSGADTVKRLDETDYKERVERWARVEVRAPRSGIILEKNTNVGDIADPGKDPPLFRIGDLKTLSVWIHPPEEYLPALQELLAKGSAEDLRLELKLQAEPKAPAIEGRLLRFAPSLDPNMRTPLLLARVDNDDNRLIVGQLVTATIFVREDTNLVEIPMKALNEVHGQSLVFVQTRAPSGKSPAEFTLRRVAVVHRFADKAQVRRRLTKAEREQNRKEQEKSSKEGAVRRLPIEPLEAGERVVTGGVVEMTDALEDLKSQPQGK
jgi:cobalt-zinc-cadmium efflux system membrane fusion protein